MGFRLTEENVTTESSILQTTSSNGTVFNITVDDFGNIQSEGVSGPITASPFTVEINENPVDGQALGTVHAFTPVGALSFTLVSETVSGAFNVNHSTGAVTVGDAAAFDFEEREYLTATVRINRTIGDDTDYVDVKATVNLIDVNEISEDMLWNGDLLTFTKADGADPTHPDNQDKITGNVCLTRGDEGVLFNIATEESADNSISPAGTEWAQGTFSDLTTGSLMFTNFRDACPGGKPKNSVGIPFVVHLIEDNIYIELTITSWSQGKEGGFTYTRSTAVTDISSFTIYTQLGFEETYRKASAFGSIYLNATFTDGNVPASNSNVRVLIDGGEITFISLLTSGNYSYIRVGNIGTDVLGYHTVQLQTLDDNGDVVNSSPIRTFEVVEPFIEGRLGSSDNKFIGYWGVAPAGPSGAQVTVSTKFSTSDDPNDESSVLYTDTRTTGNDNVFTRGNTMSISTSLSPATSVHAFTGTGSGAVHFASYSV